MITSWNEWKAQKQQKELNEGNAIIGRTATVLGFQQGPEGIQLKIQTDEGESGVTTPLSNIQAMNLPFSISSQMNLKPDERVYAGVTKSGQRYTFKISDRIAQRVLPAFFNWRKQSQVTGAKQPIPQAAPVSTHPGTV